MVMHRRAISESLLINCKHGHPTLASQWNGEYKSRQTNKKHPINPTTALPLVQGVRDHFQGATGRHCPRSDRLVALPYRMMANHGTL